MSHAITNPQRRSRMPVRPRTPASASAADEGGDYSRSRSSSRPPPLTPRNTMVQQGSSDDDHEPVMTSTHRRLTLSDLDHDMRQHDEGAESDSGSLHSGYDYEANSPGETRSEPLPDSLRSRTITHARPNKRVRSSSVPSRPMKSAIARSPPPEGPSAAANSKKKRAHFDEGSVPPSHTPHRSMLDLARANRDGSLPPGTEFVPTIASYDSLFTDWSNRRHSSEKEAKDAQEIAEAIGVFEVVVKELMQAAEESSDAHNKLVLVAKEVAGAILESQNEDHPAIDEVDETETADDEVDIANSRVVWDGRRERLRSMNRGSADDDVDESCITAFDPEAVDPYDDTGDRHSDEVYEDAHQKPKVLFAIPDGELKALDLPTIATEPSRIADIVRSPSFANTRRVSDCHTYLINNAKTEPVPRRSSMTDFTKLKSKMSHPPLVSPKASPAGCAVTACSVRAGGPPHLNTLYEHPSERREIPYVDWKSTKTAHTVRSGDSMLQMVWDERPMCNPDSGVRLAYHTRGSERISPHDADPPSPMEKVKTKLAAWSWARERGAEAEESDARWLPLLPLDDSTSHQTSRSLTPYIDAPFAPPNTERHSGASSTRPSAPHSRLGSAEDEEEEQVLELKAKPILKRQPSQPSYLNLLPIEEHSTSKTPSPPGGARPTKALPRQLSNLAAEEVPFKTHRDSVELLHRKEYEQKMINQQLMNARDSVILTKTKFDTKFSGSGSSGLERRQQSWNRIGGLSPILDASPPNERVQDAKQTIEKAAKVALEEHEQVCEGEHVGCPVCEVERPRWHEMHCRKGTKV